jgi:hypothetical protein
MDYGWLWMAVTVVGVGALGAALFYGMTTFYTRRKTARTEEIRDRNTERLYQRTAGEKLSGE